VELTATEASHPRGEKVKKGHKETRTSRSHTKELRR
jgi:hypothetical protein